MSELYKDWKFKRIVTINSEKISGEKVLDDFPFKFLIKEKSIAEVAKKNGDDFLFIADDGITKLDHEIHTWNPETGELIAFIRIPKLSPFENTSLFFYYGNPNSENQENKKDLWAAYQMRKSFTSRSSNALEIVKFLNFQIQTLEYLFPKDWFINTKKTNHPGFKRWKLCRDLLDRNGKIEFRKDLETETEVIQTLLETAIITESMEGDMQNYKIGDLENYGDDNVHKRIKSEIIDPHKYFHILTELNFGSWCKSKLYSFEAFQESGADHRFVIPTWDKPIMVDCKHLTSRNPKKVGSLITKANKQIKTLNSDCYGLAVIDLTAKLPIPCKLSDEIPEVLREYINASKSYIINCNKSVSGVLFFWNAIHILGDSAKDKVIMPVLRTMSHLVLHKNPINAITKLSDLDMGRMVQFIIKNETVI